MDWSFTNIKGRQTHPSNPFRVARNTFSASNFGFKIGLLFTTLKSNQNHPRSSENRPQDPPKTPLKKQLMFQRPKFSKMAPLTKTTFLLLQSLQKSSQNRCQNSFKICFKMDTLLESWNPKKLDDFRQTINTSFIYLTRSLIYRLFQKSESEFLDKSRENHVLYQKKPLIWF